MISILIICRDERAYIDDCLDAICRAAAGIPSEIVIVDGQSRDDTVAHCRARASDLPILLRIVESEPGYARQRNAGVRAARFDWIAFVSADVRVPPDWLREIAAHAGDGADLMIGRFELVPDEGRGAWMASLARTIYPPVAGDPVEGCSTVNLVVRREVLLAHPFDESVPACEDKELAHRVRTRAAIRLTARPQHLARESFPRWLRKIFREARALARLARTREAFPDCFGWRAHARRALLLLLLALVLAVGGSLALGCAALAAALVSASVHVHGWPRGGASPMRHAASMLAITAGVFAGFIPQETS